MTTDSESFQHGPASTEGLKRRGPLLWTSLVDGFLKGRHDPPTFRVVFFFVAVLGILVASVSFYVTRREDTQIASEERTLQRLQTQGDTIRGEIAKIGFSLDVLSSERETPHPVLVDRDAQLIGGHVDISWTDESQAKFSQPIYVISLTRLPNSTEAVHSTEHPESCSIDYQRTRAHTDQRNPRPVDQQPANLDPGCEQLFIASDSAHRTSRIPLEAESRLPPGRYVWKVAAVSQGYKISDNRDPEIGMLSKWSNYGSFTLYGDLQSRVKETRRVRVGVNLEQNSRFARLVGGKIVGEDVDLVRMLVEGCIASAGAGRNITLSSPNCTKYLSAVDTCRQRGNLQDEGFTEQGQKCVWENTHKESTLAVDFVALPSWGDWRQSLRRKEIDLFVGGLTAAGAREGGGIRFLENGYRTYSSLIYLDPSDANYAAGTLDAWTKQSRHVGVIANSSNEVLLDDIIEARCRALWRVRHKVGAEPANECPLIKVLFRDYPELDRAMDLGSVDAILIDSTFVTYGEWDHLKPISDLSPAAWQQYEATFLQYPTSNREKRKLEHLSFAAAVDKSNMRPGGLFRLLNTALQSDQVKQMIKNISDSYGRRDR